MTLPFYCVTCNHMRTDHVEGAGACQWVDRADHQCTCQKFVSPFLEGAAKDDLLMAACHTVAARCLSPFRADEQALNQATSLIYDFVTSHMTGHSPLLEGDSMQATASQASELKSKHGASDAQVSAIASKLAVVPGFSWTALLAFLSAVASGTPTLQEFLAIFGLGGNCSIADCCKVALAFPTFNWALFVAYLQAVSNGTATLAMFLAIFSL